MFLGFSEALKTEEMVRTKLLNHAVSASTRLPPNYKRDLKTVLIEDLDKLTADLGMFNLFFIFFMICLCVLSLLD